MLQESSRPVTAHKLEMQNRNHVDLTGITEVISFDNKEMPCALRVRICM